jgi:hypothetical protein
MEMFLENYFSLQLIQLKSNGIDVFENICF